MISYKFITICLPFPAVSNVSDCIFCAMDSYICHFPMGHTCLCFHMVKYFSHSINYLLLHFYCYSCSVVIFFLFRFYPYRRLLIVHYIYTFSFFLTGGHIHFSTCHLRMRPYGMLPLSI